MVNEPHQCDHCNRAFGSAHEKKRHMELAHREETAMTYHCTECERTFDTQRGLEVHTGRKHGKMARTPKDGHPWRSPAVMPEPEQKADLEPTPDEDTPATPKRTGMPVVADVRLSVRINEPDYRMELIETLADHLAMLQDADVAQATLAHIKAVARS